MKQLTKKPWFSPKRFNGWGWSVSSWQGGVATAIFVGLLISDVALFKHKTMGIITFIFLTAIFLVLVLLTSTPPRDSNSL